MTKLIPLPKLLKKAQDKFNAHIRERDKELGCISCGNEVQQAGHYFSQGQHSALALAACPSSAGLAIAGSTFLVMSARKVTIIYFLLIVRLILN